MRSGRSRIWAATSRMKHSKGLVYIAALLAVPGREIPALELAALGDGAGSAEDQAVYMVGRDSAGRPGCAGPAVVSRSDRGPPGGDRGSRGMVRCRAGGPRTDRVRLPHAGTRRCHWVRRSRPNVGVERRSGSPTCEEGDHRKPGPYLGRARRARAASEEHRSHGLQLPLRARSTGIDLVAALNRPTAGALHNIFRTRFSRVKRVFTPPVQRRAIRPTGRSKK